jgi:glycosyltransferase involved in cell wall biosynthesis
LGRYGDGGPNLLFVGRLVPNKRQEDLVKLLHACRRILPTARLFLVGVEWVAGYADWLAELARSLGVEDRVVMPGRVSQPDLLAYYRLANLYVSMSEHEGFGKPLVESMYLGVPVLAFAAGAVEETLGGCGVLFRHKHYPALAELVDLLLADEGLRERLVARGRARAAAFLAPAVREQWGDYLCGYHEIFDER